MLDINYKQVKKFDYVVYNSQKMILNSLTLDTVLFLIVGCDLGVKLYSVKYNLLLFLY